MAKEGDTAKIQGTPAIFVNGRVLDRGQMIPVLEGAYRSLKK
jgi:protein-disulfide isomerase